MPVDIIELIEVQRRSTGDVVDYVFRVSNGKSYRDVSVGITGQAINPVGKPPRPKEVLTKVAKAWLGLQLQRGFDPFNLPSARVPDVPTAVVDHWIDHGELPPWP